MTVPTRLNLQLRDHDNGNLVDNAANMGPTEIPRANTAERRRHRLVAVREVQS
jgi:hypothetical protein